MRIWEVELHPSPFDQSEFVELVRRLCDRPSENEWLEFKENLADAEQIGEYISALSNAAALRGEPRAYMVWGVRDQTHEITGTSFQPQTAKARGNEDLVPWLLRALSPQPTLTLHEGEVEGNHVVVIEIVASTHMPLRFKGEEYIRVGSYKKKLRDNPALAGQLWRTFDQTPFEFRIASDSLDAADALGLLDFEAYFNLQGLAVPANVELILKALLSDRVLDQQPSGRYCVTNLGALMFAKRIKNFPHLSRKSVRVIKYDGVTKVNAQREQEGGKGYASGFSGLVDYIDDLLPRNEVIGRARREDVSMYPEVAIRELVANALIHQDMSVTGSGPLFEIYDDRIEITNPGEPLVEPARFIDAPPRSRNEKLATLMRRCNLCEERGSGWDRVGFLIEYHQLPAPLIRVTANHTAVTLFSQKPVKQMDREERIRAVYLHACLRLVSSKRLTNGSLRERFGLSDKDSSTVSSYIREALEAKMIVAHDPDAGKKLMQYVPAWVKDVESRL